MPMRTKSKLTLTHLVIEKNRNLEEIQILKVTIKILKMVKQLNL